MIAVLQRVTSAFCVVEGELIGQCGEGLMILLGVKAGDDEADARLLAEKIAKLRIFEDENGKMNRSVNDISGSALVVSQFTLLANYSHGNRPDYLASEKPSRAKELYECFASLLGQLLISGKVQTGRFGADMKLEIHNDGPVTIVMDSAVLKK
jgi:D-tyrosyl-tRNA(Tyr) deacylase